jgi:hypothetical protein
MVEASGVVLPYEPQSIEHRKDEERRKLVSEWLQQRERELDDHPAPSVVPEPPPAGDKPARGQKS